MKISWIDPKLCTPPHRVTRPENFEQLREYFYKFKVWGSGHPALLGYTDTSGIQLISGSHRWAAAVETLDLIPVAILSRIDVERIWGTDEWLGIIARAPLVSGEV